VFWRPCRCAKRLLNSIRREYIFKTVIILFLVVKLFFIDSYLLSWYLTNKRRMRVKSQCLKITTLNRENKINALNMLTNYPSRLLRKKKKKNTLIHISLSIKIMIPTKQEFYTFCY
jgi:hypothetical protein